MQISENTNTEVDQNSDQNADRLADFIMFAQRSFLLDLSKELNEGNVSYAQFFLLGYLANEDYLTMTDISKKMGHSGGGLQPNSASQGGERPKLITKNDYAN